jgi:hypothetical protein
VVVAHVFFVEVRCSINNYLTWVALRISHQLCAIIGVLLLVEELLGDRPAVDRD